MRLLAILAAAVILTGCDYGFTFQPENLTPDQLLDRAELVFIGVIQEQHIDSWPFFRLAGADRGQNCGDRFARRRVRVETVFEGSTAINISIFTKCFGTAPFLEMPTWPDMTGVSRASFFWLAKNVAVGDRSALDDLVPFLS